MFNSSQMPFSSNIVKTDFGRKSTTATLQKHEHICRILFTMITNKNL